MLFDWSSFYWKSILFWKTDTKRGFVAHIVQVTGGETILARFFPPEQIFHAPQNIFKPPPRFWARKYSTASCSKPEQLALFSWGKCWLLTFAKFLLFLPFVDKENNQLLWQTPPQDRKMHDPEFSSSQIKFPDIDIFGPNSFSLSENNWIHPSLGRFTQFLIKAKHSGWKNDLRCRQTNQ